jgi:hypothetical protein
MCQDQSFTDELASIEMGVGALPMPLVVLPSSNVLDSTGPCHGPLAMLLATPEFTDVLDSTG